MKTKEKKELGQKTMPELTQMLREAKEAVYTLRLEKAQYKMKNMRAVFNKRKDVARILTKMKEKETSAGSQV
jgi:ribosomal protein L29